MLDESLRTPKSECLADVFANHAVRDNSRAEEWREWHTQKRREAEEHPAVPELRAQAEEVAEVVLYWDEQAMRCRPMEAKYRLRSEMRRSGNCPSRDSAGQ